MLLKKMCNPIHFSASNTFAVKHIEVIRKEKLVSILIFLFSMRDMHIILAESKF